MNAVENNITLMNKYEDIQEMYLVFVTVVTVCLLMLRVRMFMEA